MKKISSLLCALVVFSASFTFSINAHGQAMGYLYGLTYNGGTYGYGTLYKMDTLGNMTVLVNFDSTTNGAHPAGSVIQATNGMLYGMTSEGGAGGGYGTIFECTPSGTLTTLYNFNTNAGLDGAYPTGSLVEANDGNLYGVAQSGGANTYGTMFKLTLAGAFTRLSSFTVAKGAYPLGTLIQANDGNLWGLCYQGGTAGYGSLFKATLAGVVTRMVSFDTTNGSNPWGALIQATDGNLYGMTETGGRYYGTLFKCTLAGALTTLVNFNFTNGCNPFGSLIQAKNDTLYGMTYVGGNPGYGISFKCTLGGTISTLTNFDTVNGANPYGSLIQGTDGKLYGSTVVTGGKGYGTTFVSSTGGSLNTLVHFNKTNGASPYLGNLDEVMSASIATHLTCTGDSLDAIVLGGVTPFTYTWSNGATTSYIHNLTTGGTYTVTVVDNRGITVTATTTISSYTVLYATTSVTTNVTCYGGNNGSASSTVGGGTAPYTYSWTGGGNGSNVSGLTAGSYTLSVSDNKGCSATSSVNITQPTQIIVTPSVTSNVNCNGNANGSGSVSAVGGTGAYTYSWNPGSGTNASQSGLSANMYTVTVTDSRGCTGSATVNITQPALLVATATITANISCFGNNDGSASSAVSGGTSPYTYSWSNSQTTTSISALSQGSYTLSVTDVNGCAASSSITITEPNQLNVSANVTSNIHCNGINTGSAVSIVSGGTSPYTYSWSNSQSTLNIIGLSAGTYTVNVTDNNGCAGTAGVTITQPATALTATADSISASAGCNGSAWIIPAGGTAPYTYLWTTGGQTTDSIQNQCSGTYCYTVTDGNGCTSSACVTIKLATGVNGITNKTGVSIYPDPNNGNFTITLAGSGNSLLSICDEMGREVYKHIIDPAIPDSTLTINLSNLPSGVYLAKITTGTGVVNQKLVIQK